jgi:hypothetical protein
MIGTIKNPWLRRPLVVGYAPILFTVCLVTLALEAVAECGLGDECRDCWRLLCSAWKGNK